MKCNDMIGFHIVQIWMSVWANSYLGIIPLQAGFVGMSSIQNGSYILIQQTNSFSPSKLA